MASVGHIQHQDGRYLTLASPSAGRDGYQYPYVHCPCDPAHFQHRYPPPNINFPNRSIHPTSGHISRHDTRMFRPQHHGPRMGPQYVVADLYWFCGHPRHPRDVSRIGHFAIVIGSHPFRIPHNHPCQIAFPTRGRNSLPLC